MDKQELLADLKNVIPPVTKKNVLKLALVMVAMLVCAVFTSLALSLLIPHIEQASHGYGYLAIFLITLISSASVLFPVPGTIAWVGLILTMDMSPFWVGVVASIGGSLGEITGYWVGFLGRAIIAPQYSRHYQVAEKWIGKYGGLTIFLFAFLWVLPFDVVGIVAGVLRYPTRKFLLYCWLGRLPRSIIEAYLYYYTGTVVMEVMLPYLPSWLRGGFGG